MLFREVESEFAALPADVQAAIRPYLVPPNDPESAFGPAPALQPADARTSTFALEASAPNDTLCRQPAAWIPTDWTPSGGAPDDGFRVWVCAGSENEKNRVVTPVIDAVSPLWEPMTRSAPDGMGKPVPDTVKGNAENFGNGKIDIMVVYTSECQDRTCPLLGDPGEEFQPRCRESAR